MKTEKEIIKIIENITKNEILKIKENSNIENYIYKYSEKLFKK